MTTQITINPLPESNPSPYQARKVQAPDIVNDSFFASFKDALDIINPLQQIPGVATAYRELTGSPISTGARLAGGALFGGPIGFLAALAGAILEDTTGKDIGGTLLAMVRGEKENESAMNTSEPNDYLPGNRRIAYNAYLDAQRLG
jgi:hypothetical protein